MFSLDWSCVGLKISRISKCKTCCGNQINMRTFMIDIFCNAAESSLIVCMTVKLFSTEALSLLYCHCGCHHCCETQIIHVNVKHLSQKMTGICTFLQVRLGTELAYIRSTAFPMFYAINSIYYTNYIKQDNPVLFRIWLYNQCDICQSIIGCLFTKPGETFLFFSVNADLNRQCQKVKENQHYH